MSTDVLTIDSRPRIRLKAVALPVEHGSWGFLMEPLVAGMAVAPSMASPWIAMIVIGAFLMRQPLKIVLSDWQAGKWLPQTKFALRFLLGYAAVFWVGLIGCIIYARADSFVPFALVVPFAAYQIYCDATRNSRQLGAEIIGAVAISSSIAVIALADGWTNQKAYAIWAIIAARLISSIFYVRNRLRLEKGKAYSRSIPIGTHIGAVALALVLAVYGVSPYLTALMFVILLTRSIVGLSPFRRKIKAIKIGIWEVIYGTLTVLSLIAGYYAGF